jgi:hypothetical protein
MSRKWKKARTCQRPSGELGEHRDLEGARQQMRDVLAVEIVPHYLRAL